MTFERLRLRASSAWTLTKFKKYDWAHDWSVRKLIRGLGRIRIQDSQWRGWIEQNWTDLLLTNFRGGVCTAPISRLSSEFLWFIVCWFVEWKTRAVSGWIERYHTCNNDQQMHMICTHRGNRKNKQSGLESRYPVEWKPAPFFRIRSYHSYGNHGLGLPARVSLLFRRFPNKEGC